MTTYLVFADKMGLKVTHFEIQANGQIGLVGGRYEFTSVNIHAKIFISDEAFREKATLAMARAQKYCLVSNSVKATIDYDSTVLLDKHPLHVDMAPFSGS